MMNDLDISDIEGSFFNRGNPLKKLIQISLDLLNAHQAGILFGTNASRIKFLPPDLWDRGILDNLHGRGFKGFVLRTLGKTIVTAKHLSPVFFYSQDESGETRDNDGLIAYILRNCASYYRKGISVFICPEIRSYLRQTGHRYAHIPFFCYDGTRISTPEELITVDTHIIQHFQALNYVCLYIPNYGILVLNTIDTSLLETSQNRFVREKDLTQRLDILVRLVEAASLACLGQLKGKSAADLLLRKEQHLRRTVTALAENEQKFRDLYENAPVAYFSISPDGIIHQCNNQARRLLGYDDSDIAGKSMFSLMSDSSELPGILNDMKKGVPTDTSTRTCELQLKPQEQKGPLWASLSIDAITDRNGRLIEFRMAATDISKRKHAEEALQVSEKRFRDLAEMLPEAIFETSRDHDLTFANHRAFDLFRFSQEDLEKGVKGTDFIIPEDRDRSRDNMTKRLKDTTLGTVEYTALRKDGSTFPALIHTAPIIRDSALVGYRGIAIDITERKHLERKILERNTRLKRLNEHLANLEETYRKALASDLHDSVIQILGVCVATLKNIRESGNLTDETELSGVQGYLEQAIQELRSMIFQLSPPILNDFDIGTVLGHLVRQCNQTYNSSIRYINRSNGQGTGIDHVLKVALYRAVNELILNLIKHSGTLNAEVELSWENDHLTIRVEDRGIGFDASGLMTNDTFGYGLFGMAERIRNLGGDVDIVSNPGHGTRIVLRIHTAASDTATPGTSR